MQLTISPLDIHGEEYLALVFSNKIPANVGFH
jgi:hypothetical protein